MTLNEMIAHRKSCRSFTNVPVDTAIIETIKAFPMKQITDKPDSRLNAGIALAHLYVANEETFCFFKVEKMTDLPGFR